MAVTSRRTFLTTSALVPVLPPEVFLRRLSRTSEFPAINLSDGLRTCRTIITFIKV